MLNNVYIWGGIVDPKVYGLFYCPGEAMPHHAYYAESQAK